MKNFYNYWFKTLNLFQIIEPKEESNPSEAMKKMNQFLVYLSEVYMHYLGKIKIKVIIIE